MNNKDNLLKVNSIHSVLKSDMKTSHVMTDGNIIIKKGTQVGIIGESGSGKTQLFKTITGTQDMIPGIIQGNVEFFINNNKQEMYVLDPNNKYNLCKEHNKIKRKVIGFIPQDPKSYLHPYWSIEKLFDKMFKIKKRSISFDKFLKKYLNQVDINSDLFRNKLPSQLSGGEAQRIMIALILSKEPELIIADEITTGLDVSRQRTIIETFNQIKKNNPNLTMVFISHDFGFLSHVVDEYYVLYGGFICEHIIDKNQFLNIKLLHPYTQDLISSLLPTKKKQLIDELSCDVNLKKPLCNCPYLDKCRYMENDIQKIKNKCTESLPPIMDNKGDIEKNLHKKWKRCWYRYE